MAVVKAQQASVRFGGAVCMDLADFKAEAARLLAEAQGERDRILREARVEAARLRAQEAEAGRQEGFEIGRAEGTARGKAEIEEAARELARQEHSARLAALSDSWEQSLAHWEVSREALEREARRHLLRLALGIASRVVQRVVEADPDVALQQLEGALELLGKATAVTMVCSPDDRQHLEEHLPRVLERLGSTVNVTFIADPSVAAGGALIRVAEGGIDATIETQLDRIAHALIPGGEGRQEIP
jgi:flagellar assembly protein FliH